MLAVALLSILISIVVWGILSMKRRYQHFKKLGIKHFEPMPFIGNTYEMILGRKQLGEAIDDLYRAFPEEEILGFYQFGKAQLVPRSPELVNQILVQNFSNFANRITTGLKEGEVNDPYDGNLFALNGNTWRIARNRFSPLFTAGKLKFMYNSISDCGKNLANVLDKQNGQEMDISDIMGVFTMDVIGSTAFGIEAHNLDNPNSEFRAMGKKLFDGSILGNIRQVLLLLFPKLSKALGFKGIFPQDVGDYFIGVVSQKMEERKDKKMTRNDFIQMLVQLKEKGKVEIQTHDSGDDYLKTDDNENNTFELKMTDNLLLGGALTFLSAGFHSVAMTLSYALYELAQHPEVVEKLRAEIREVVQDQEPTYEHLKEMHYLEKVAKEALRLYPTAATLARVCTREYKSPSGVVFKPGQQVLIPVYSLHRDPAYWSEPNVFNPDRFDPDCPPQPGTYMPFGDGPRICIAMRFAMMELKYALVKLISKYNFELTKKTEVPLKIHPRNFLLTPKNGIHLRVTKAY